MPDTVPPSPAATVHGTPIRSRSRWRVIAWVALGLLADLVVHLLVGLPAMVILHERAERLPWDIRTAMSVVGTLAALPFMLKALDITMRKA